MTKKSTWIVLWLLALAPVALVAACYGALPDRVPTHWGLDGTVTYGPKALLWLFALLSPALTALLRLLPRLDPRRGNYARFQRCYDGFCAALLLFLLLGNITFLIYDRAVKLCFLLYNTRFKGKLIKL